MRKPETNRSVSELSSSFSMNQPSSSSDRKKTRSRARELSMATFASITEDLIQNILARLPASSFASAACVSKSWSQICNRILSRPKISSALSLTSPPHVALEEVLNKVLSEPIRPHFAIASVLGGGFESKTLRSLAEKLGSKTPIILTSTSGIMGRDCSTEEFREVMQEEECSDDSHVEEPRIDANSGIVLTVGYVPGLKVDVIPLLRLGEMPEAASIDDFVMNIRNYAASASGRTSPIGIIMFGDANVDQNPVLEKLDCALSKETIIVGDERTQFLYRSGTESRNVCGRRKYFSSAVALVFARDRGNPHGTGEIQFHAALSNGVSAIGPQYKAVSVRQRADHTTWLTARREGERDILDGQTILNDITNELGDRVVCPDLYIGITKRRNCSIGMDKPKLMTSLALHGVTGGDEECLFADGVGIRTGDYFQFYHSDPRTALSSCSNVSRKLRGLNLNWSSKNCLHSRDTATNVGHKEFIGGFIFSCCGRGESFFGGKDVDSSPILDNFPGAPSAGMFCGGEIARGCSTLNGDESQEEGTPLCSLHVYSTAYLVISHTPPPMLQ